MRSPQPRLPSPLQVTGVGIGCSRRVTGGGHSGKFGSWAGGIWPLFPATHGTGLQIPTAVSGQALRWDAEDEVGEAVLFFVPLRMFLCPCHIPDPQFKGGGGDDSTLFSRKKRPDPFPCTPCPHLFAPRPGSPQPPLNFSPQLRGFRLSLA